jgi:hypothetical protein
MQPSYQTSFLIALAQTLGIETLVLLLLTKIAFKKEFAGHRIFFIITIGCMASLLTLPYVWFVFPFIIRVRLWYLVIGEAFALFMESIIYYIIFKIPYRLALFISFICNLCSFLGAYLIKLFIPY